MRKTDALGRRGCSWSHRQSKALISLFSGAAVGPEAPLAFLSGGLGSLIAVHRRQEVVKPRHPRRRL
ncbi:MAG: hypothetical protein ACJ8CB_31705 [Ktedonobacteraceae bacterium]